MWFVSPSFDYPSNLCAFLIFMYLWGRRKYFNFWLEKNEFYQSHRFMYLKMFPFFFLFNRNECFEHFSSDDRQRMLHIIIIFPYNPQIMLYDPLLLCWCLVSISKRFFVWYLIFLIVISMFDFFKFNLQAICLV